MDGVKNPPTTPRSGPCRFTEKELAHMFEQAKRDDWHRIFVGSEIRVLIAMAQESLECKPGNQNCINDRPRNDVNSEAMSILVQRAGGELFVPDGADIKVGTTFARREEGGVRFKFSPKGAQ